MNTFDLIQAKFMLQYEVYEIDDDAAWVSDVLGEEARKWFMMRGPEKNYGIRFSELNDNMLALYPRSQWPVLIKAPTGRGKNWFVIRYLANYAKSLGYRILLLTNRSALTKQQ